MSAKAIDGDNSWFDGINAQVNHGETFNDLKETKFYQAQCCSNQLPKLAPKSDIKSKSTSIGLVAIFGHDVITHKKYHENKRAFIDSNTFVTSLFPN
jgi:hypothetical protein